MYCICPAPCLSACMFTPAIYLFIYLIIHIKKEKRKTQLNETGNAKLKSSELIHSLTMTYYFLIPIYTSCSGRYDVGQGTVNILQHYSRIADLALAVSFC